MGNWGVDYKIPDGAVKIHIYPLENVLRPRGSMRKESLGELIVERIRSAYESWTDKNYWDNPSKEELLKILHFNLKSECDAAWATFMGSINK